MVKGSGVPFQAPGTQRGLLRSSSPQFPLGTEGDTTHRVVCILANILEDSPKIRMCSSLEREGTLSQSTGLVRQPFTHSGSENNEFVTHTHGRERMTQHTRRAPWEATWAAVNGGQALQCQGVMAKVSVNGLDYVCKLFWG